MFTCNINVNVYINPFTQPLILNWVLCRCFLDSNIYYSYIKETATNSILLWQTNKCCYLVLLALVLLRVAASQLTRGSYRWSSWGIERHFGTHSGRVWRGQTWPPGSWLPSPGGRCPWKVTFRSTLKKHTQRVWKHPVNVYERNVFTRHWHNRITHYIIGFWLLLRNETIHCYLVHTNYSISQIK